MNPPIKRQRATRIAWCIFASALVYLYALQLWKAHYLPGEITGTRLSFGLWVYFELISKIAIIAVPIFLFFFRWRMAIITSFLSASYFIILKL